MSKSRQPVRAEGKELTFVCGSFAPDTANPPTALKGNGWSVVWTSAGLWTLTFEEAYTELVAGLATLQRNTAVDTVAQIGVYTAASRTITIKSLAAAVATDIAANADNRVNFIFVFRRSSVTR